MGKERNAITSHLLLLLMLASIQVLAAPGQNNARQIDPTWRLFDVSLSYIDRQQRLIVAGDREFSVPRATKIFNREGRRIRFNDLQAGDNIWLYLSVKANSSGRPVPAERIELVR